MNWRMLLFFPALALGVVLFLWQIRTLPEQGSDAVEVAPVAVRVVSIAPINITTRVSGFGRVKPHRTWEAVSRVDGDIVEVFDDLSEGVIVPEGATLLRIDPRDYEIARDRGAANLETAEAQLAELDAQEVNTGEQITLERQIENVLQAEFNRQKRLVANGTAPAVAVEQSQRELLSQQRRVLDLENQLALFPVQRVSIQATLRTRTVELEGAERDLANVKFTAPFRARVATTEAEVGEYIRVGTTVLTLHGVEAADITAEVQPDEMRAALQLLLPDLETMGPGVFDDPNAANRALELAGITAIVRNTRNGQSDSWPARIIRLDGSVDQTTGTLGIIVRVDNPARPDPATRRAPLPTGAFVEIEFTGTVSEPVLSLPRASVMRDETGSFVYVVGENGGLARQSVSIAGRAGGDVVIETGLARGARVLLAAPQPAIIGMPLAPVEVSQ